MGTADWADWLVKAKKAANGSTKVYGSQISCQAQMVVSCLSISFFARFVPMSS